MTQTVEEIYNTWLEAKSENTRKAYDMKVKEFFKLVIDKEPSKITEEDLNDLTYPIVYANYIRVMKDRGIKEKTINGYIVRVRSYLTALERADIFDINFSKLKDNVLYSGDLNKSDGGHNEAISTSELKKLEEWLVSEKEDGMKYATLADFLFHTAVRITATMKIKWQDFDVYESPYGNTFAKLVVYDKGNKRNEKDIPVEHFYNLQESMGYDGTDEALVFEGIAVSRFRKYLQEFSGIVGHNITPHSFKVGSATTLYNRTKDIFKVSKFLDHESIATTQEYLRENPNPNESGIAILYSTSNPTDYQHLTKEQLIAIISKHADIADTISVEARNLGFIE